MSKNESGNFDNDNYSTCLRVQDSGEIHIFAIDSIESDNGIVVADGGSVTLECDKSVKFTGNTVGKGGDIHVEAETMYIKGNFTVEKGGTFSMIPKK